MPGECGSFWTCGGCISILGVAVVHPYSAHDVKKSVFDYDDFIIFGSDDRRCSKFSFKKYGFANGNEFV